jgi:hypothetical protein
MAETRGRTYWEATSVLSAFGLFPPLHFSVAVESGQWSVERELDVLA